MRSSQNRRGKGARMLTVGEIKRAICTHERLAPAGASEQHATGGSWQTRLACPTCGAWTIRETPATADSPATDGMPRFRRLADASVPAART